MKVKISKKQLATNILIVCFVFAVIIAFWLIISLLGTDKMTCKADEVEITIEYDSDNISGYSAYGMTYDLEGQREYARQIGTDPYLNEFESWFSINTGGVCQR